jgi:hypothetical protein
MLSAMFHSGVSALFAAAVLAVAFLGLSPRLVRWLGPSDDRFYRALWLWVVASFLLHLSVGAIGTLTHLRDYIAPDAGVYQEQALGILRHWSSGVPISPLPFPGKEGFPYLLAGLYTSLGTGPVLGLVVNAALSASLIPLVADTQRRLFPASDPRYSAAILTLMPSMLAWPGQLMREAAALFLIAAIVNLVLRFNERRSWVTGALLGLFFALLLTVRAPMTLVLLPIFVVCSCLTIRPFWPTVAAHAAVLAAVAILVFGVGLGYSGFADTVGLDLPRIDSYRKGVSGTQANSSIATGDVDTPDGVARALPLSLARFTFGPFPWEVRSIRELPGLSESLLWLALLPSLFFGLLIAWRRRLLAALPSVVAAACLIPAFALVAGNYGLVIRERAQVILLLTPMIAVGLASWLPERFESLRRGKREEAAPNPA